MKKDITRHIRDSDHESESLRRPFVTSHAVVIGIDHYAISPLQSAVNDAQSIAQALEVDHGYRVTLLTDFQATGAALRTLFEENLRQQVGSDDRVIVYFAGHGIADDADAHDVPQGYLVPQDGRTNDLQSLLSMPWLQEVLGNLSCRHLLLVLDCCFSGAFRWSLTRSLSTVGQYTLYRERYERFIQDPAWQVIASAGADQVASDVASRLGMRPSDGTHSPFALALIRALQGAVPQVTQGGVITATGLYQFLRDAVDIEDRRQTPSISYLKKHDKGEFIFITPHSLLSLPDAEALSAANNPYRGLDVYRAEHTALFFGREAAAAEIHTLMAQHPLVVVTGPSGSGKSSMVRAGVIPKLGQDWHIVEPVRLGKDPKTTLAQALQQNVATFNAVDTLKGLCTTHPNQRLLLVFDQFEELVTLADEDERNYTLDILNATIAALSSKVCILITVRSDFEPFFKQGKLQSQWLAGRYVISRMNRTELREVIEKPALERVLFFESDALINSILDEVESMPTPLPLLSFLLSELYLGYLQRGGTDRTFTNADYQKLGGVAGALRNRADAEYAQFDDAHRVAMRHVLLRMVSLEGATSARRPVPKDELVFTDAGDNGRIATVLQRLTDPDVRLVSASVDAYDKPIYELAHDTLLNSWEQLQQWQRTDQSDILLRQRLAPDVRDWLRHGRKSEGLWDRNPNRATAVLALGSGWLNASEQAFVSASEAKRKHNQRSLVAIITTVILGLAALSIFAWIQRNTAIGNAQVATSNEQTAIASDNNRATQQALAEDRERARATQEAIAIQQRDEALRQQKQSRSREIAVIAKTQLDTDPELALLLAIEANKFPEGVTAESEDILRKALPQAHVQSTINVSNTRFVAIDLSNDETKLASLDSTGAIYIWDMATGSKADQFMTETKCTAKLTFLKNPNHLMIYGGSDTCTDGLQVWNWRTKQRVLQVPGFVTAAAQPIGIDEIADPSVTDDDIVFVQAHKGVWVVSAYDSQAKPLFSIDPFINPNTISVSRNRNFVALGEGSTLAVWDTRAKAKASTYSSAYPQSEYFGAPKFSTSSYSTTLVVRSPDGAYLPIITDVSAPLQSISLTGHIGKIRDIQFTPDERMVVTAGEDGTIRFWSVLSGKELGQCQGHKYAAVKLRVADGFLASIGGAYSTFENAKPRTDPLREDRGIWIWQWTAAQSDGEYSSVTCLGAVELKGHKRAPINMVLSVALQRAATLESDSTIRIWRIEASLGDVGYRGLHKDGNMIALHTESKSITDSGIGSVYSVGTGKQIFTDTMLDMLKLSPDGRHLLNYASLGSGDFRLYEVATRQFKVLGQASGYQQFVAFSPDSKFLITGNDYSLLVGVFAVNESEKAVRVWDIPTGTLRHSIPFDNLAGLAISDDGQTIYLRSNNNAQYAYTVSLESAVAAAHSMVSRELTCDERKQYLHEDCEKASNQ